jgi:hypothetical protein
MERDTIQYDNETEGSVVRDILPGAVQEELESDKIFATKQ